MAAITFHELTSLISGSQFLTLQEGGTAPSQTRSTTKVATPSLSGYSGIIDINSASTVNIPSSGGSGPAAPNSTTGNGWRSPLYPHAQFAAGNWTLSFRLGTDSAGGSLIGYAVRVRVWRSPNADGSGATEITSAIQETGSFTNTSTSTSTAVSVTWAAPAFNLNNEYLFFTVAVRGTTTNYQHTSSFFSGGTIVTSDVTFDVTPPPVPTWDTVLAGHQRAHLDWNEVIGGITINKLNANASNMESAPTTADFSTWTETTPAVLSRDTAKFHQGSSSVKVDCANTVGTSSNFTIMQGRYLAPANTQLVGSVWVWMPSGQTFKRKLRLASDANHVNYLAGSELAHTETFTGTGDWQRVDVGPWSHTAAGYVGVEIYTPVAFKGQYWIDEAMVEVKSTAGASAWVVGSGDIPTDFAGYNLYRDTSSGGAFTTKVNTPNLLTANQASIETDLTGITGNTNTVLDRSTLYYEHGAASLHVSVNATPGDEFVLFHGLNIQPNTAYSWSARIFLPQDGYLDGFQGIHENGVGYRMFGHMNNGYQLYKAGWHTISGSGVSYSDQVADCRLLLRPPRLPDGSAYSNTMHVYIDKIQVTKSAVPLSWRPGGEALLTNSAYTDFGLNNGTTYWYKLTSVDLIGNESAKSTAISVTPAASPPAVPTGLVPTSFTKDAVSLNWNDNPEIRNLFDTNQSNAEAATAGLSAWVDSGPSPTVTRDATQGAGGSTASHRVNWSGVTATSNRELTGESPHTILPAGTLCVSSAYVKLPAGTQFQVGFRCSNAAGVYIQNGKYSAAFTATGGWDRVASPPDTWEGGRFRPGVIIYLPNSSTYTGVMNADGLMTEIKSTSGATDFVPGGNSATADIAGYNVYRATSPGGPFTKLNAMPLFYSQFNDSGLTTDVTYHYYVTSVDNEGAESAASSQASETPRYTPPSIPTGLVATGFTATSVSLDWNDNTEPDLVGYNIYYSTDYLQNGWTKHNATPVAASNYVVTGLGTGTQLQFTVGAVDNEGGISAGSSVVTETPRYTPPVAPTGLVATATSTTAISLDWNDNAESDLAGYNLYRSANADGSGAVKVNGTVLVPSTFNNTGLTINTEYYYFVRAVDNEGGESPNSEIVYEKTFNVLRIIPDSVAEQTNLTGPLANILDDPDSPDALWMNAATPSGNAGGGGATSHAAASGIANQLTNPANALGTDETSQATVVAGVQNADYANFFSFANAFDSIPSNAIITGVTVAVREWSSSSNRSSSYVRLESANGTAITTELSQALNNTTPAAGQPKVNWTAWNVLPTVAQLKAAGFGVRLRYVKTASQAADYSLDWIKVTVAWQLPAASNNGVLRVGMENPGNLPVIGAGLQEFRVRLRKSGNGANPTARVELRESTAPNTILATPIADTAISADGVLSGTWNIASLVDRYGMNVQPIIVITGTQGASVDVGAFEWNATVSKDASIHVLAPTPANNGEMFGPVVESTRVNIPPQDFSSVPPTPNLRLTMYVSSIPLSYDVPSPEILQLGGVFVPPINSAEEWGTPKVHLTLYANPADSGEEFGEDHTIVQVISTGNIPSQEAHQTPSVAIALKPNAKSSDEVVNTPRAFITLYGTGPDLSGPVSDPTIHLTLYSGSVTSAESIGIPVIQDKGLAPPKGKLVAVRVVRDLAPYIAGYQVPYDINTELYLSNINGDEIEPFPGITSAAIDMSNARDETWKISLNMVANKDINILQDWIKAVVKVKFADGRIVSYPYGTYKFFRPSGVKGLTGARWSLEGYSAESLFTEDTMRGVYVVPKGAMTMQTVYDLLVERDIDPAIIDLPFHQDVPTRADHVFDPFADESKAKRIRIMNELLNTAGFHAIYVNRAGIFTTKKYTDVREQDVVITYGADWPDEEPILTGEVSDDWEDDRFHNAVVVTEEEADNPNPIYAVAENNDPNSLGSYQNVGYWKTMVVKYKTLASQEAANNLARGQLQAASGFYRKAGWTTPPDPEREEKQYVQLNVEDEANPIIGRFKMDNLSFNAYPHPKEMKFIGSKLEEI